MKHKERLKEMRTNVHVLTLTATPIPRTLQLALSGVRELSLITTPPLDRLAVRTYITPFDPVIIRESLLREHFRGGQSFYVVPRVTDLDEIAAFLRENVPEVKFRMAHGRMAPTELEDIMTGFYDRKFDVLLSTTIVESGLDISTANTLIIHRADMFGLAQLYQLRGRVGRSKQRAYAIFTTPANRTLTAAADKRLKVLQSLDSLGAGFTLASHDLDLRGAGNLLGDEQSGHIKEVGYELYQQMIEEAVAKLRTGEDTLETDGSWSPQINIGTSVLIPESYVEDLQVRLGLYRRLADLHDQQAVDGFGAELRDRFGRVPEEVHHLLAIVSIKLLCRAANVQSVDAGPKGAVIEFRGDAFANPGSAGAVDQRAGDAGQASPRHEARHHARLGQAGGAAEGHAPADAEPREAGGLEVTRKGNADGCSRLSRAHRLRGSGCADVGLSGGGPSLPRADNSLREPGHPAGQAGEPPDRGRFRQAGPAPPRRLVLRDERSAVLGAARDRLRGPASDRRDPSPRARRFRHGQSSRSSGDAWTRPMSPTWAWAMACGCLFPWLKENMPRVI